MSIIHQHPADRPLTEADPGRVLAWSSAGALLVVMVFVFAPLSQPKEAVILAPPPDEPTAHPEQFFSLDGTLPERAPSVRTGLAFIELDDPLRATVDVLGPADSAAPDINASTAHTWLLPGGAELTVIADRGETGRVVGVFAEVPPGSPVTLPAYGSVIIGRDTPRDVVAHWGGAGAVVGNEDADYVVSYIECVGPQPVIIKFDAPDVGGAWDQPVDRMLIAYADADPGTEGCSGRSSRARQ